jgi:hypothetical protein
MAMEEFFKQFDFPVSDFYKKAAEECFRKNRVYQAAKKDLETNPKYKDFFSRFRANSIAAFIDKIASDKAQFAINGNPKKKLEAHRVLNPKVRAEQGLWEIQQKKLFIKQCLWRAEKIELPEIKACHDFQYWEHNIKNCPFLEPITEDEVELYTGYILTDDFTFEFDPFFSKQDYEGFKDEYMNSDDGGYYPEWYSYYDMRKGTGVYLTLPDVRGEKEKKYLQAYSAHEKEIKEVTAAINPPGPKSMGYYKIMNFVLDFFEENEDERTVELMKQTCYSYESKVKRESGEDYDDEPSANRDARHALRELEYIPFKVPVEAYYDWKQGLARALYTYETQQVAAAMKLVFEDYKMRLEMGIPLENTEPYAGHIKQWEKNMNIGRETILQGRELLGEPKNFDF